MEILAARFPGARVIVTEIDDEVLGVAYSGAVGRLLDAGASAYLPPASIVDVVAGVRAHLDGGEVRSLEAAAPAQHELSRAARPLDADRPTAAGTSTRAASPAPPPHRGDLS